MHDLGPATQELHRIVARVGDDDLDRTTACPQWEVRDLLGHLLALTAHFATVARHEAGSAGGPPVRLPDDWREVLAGRLDDLAVAWAEPGAWEGDGAAGGVTMPNAKLGVVALEEVVLHGWDLARAVGESFSVTDADLEAVAGFVATFEGASIEQRAGLYGPIVAVDAEGLDKVLALAGRDPRWAPAGS